VSGMACTQESHDAAKADDATWAAMRFRGYQPRVDDESPDLEMRDHEECGSTLTRPCCLSHGERERVRADNAERSRLFRVRLMDARSAVSR
jgi:hypothetical protein